MTNADGESKGYAMVEYKLPTTAAICKQKFERLYEPFGADKVEEKEKDAGKEEGGEEAGDVEEEEEEGK